MSTAMTWMGRAISASPTNPALQRADEMMRGASQLSDPCAKQRVP